MPSTDGLAPKQIVEMAINAAGSLGAGGMWHASSGSRFREAFVGAEMANLIRLLVGLARREDGV